MPSRNRIKAYSSDSYYHIYNRGVNKQKIFIDDEDHRVFLNLFKRYLSKAPVKDNKGREYDWLYEQLKLLSYCIMPNHFHLFIFQNESTAMERLTRRVFTSYTQYFNKKYHRVGPLFQSRYKASLILSESYLLHISRYIHRNPKDYSNYKYSSYKYFLGVHDCPEWLNAQALLDMFDNDTSHYQAFVEDYKNYKETLNEILPELANTHNLQSTNP